MSRQNQRLGRVSCNLQSLNALPYKLATNCYNKHDADSVTGVKANIANATNSVSLHDLRAIH